MTTMGQRLREALDLRGMQPVDLVSSTKLSKGTIYNILNDTTRPEKVWAETLTKICSALGVSRDWLLTGKGEKNSQSTFTLSSPESRPTRIDAAMLSQAMRLLELIDEIRGKPAPADTYAQRLVLAYEVVAEEIAAQGEGNVVQMDMARRVAARLRKNEVCSSDGNQRGKTAGTSA